MRCFVVIFVLVAAAYADVSHLTGYHYQQGGNGGASGGAAILSGQIGGGSGGFSGGSTGFSDGSSGFSSGSNGFGGDSIGFTSGSNGFNGGSTGFGGGSIGGLNGLSGFTSGNAGHSHHHQQHRVEAEPAEVEFVKEFYTFDAPQEEYHEDESIQRVKESLKKNLQVLFIKTPEVRGVEHAALSLAKSASESNTAIYILQKQPDISEFSNKLSLIHTHNAHKPEVHFVKYRTPEEAANAQHTIQSQYETLGGSTVHKHGGVPAILNYASHYAPAYGGHQVVSGGQPTNGIAAIIAPSSGGQQYHTGAIIAPSSDGHHVSHETSSTQHSIGSVVVPQQKYLPVAKV